uniref:Crumbs homolog 3a n=1 Tax=Cyprinus carpio TaxID=7962 RepID=A0A8C1Q1F8_CYPCA
QYTLGLIFKKHSFPNLRIRISYVQQVLPTVVVGLLAILTAVLVFVFCVVKKKRQTEGTYQPSAEEQSGARSVETPDALKLPKEERLI